MAKENNGKVAIIGSGAAAAECIKALRESGHRAEIHLFTDSRWPVYNPMLTTYYVAGKIGFDQLFPYGNSSAFFDQHDVKIHAGSAVLKLDAEARLLATTAGLEFRYDSCLIASGASCVRPRIEGIDSPKVHVMRTVEDAIRLKEAMSARPRKALVVGASMVGIKLVELFHQAGMEVCLADLAEHLFPLAAHPDCARVIESRLTGLGVKLRFGAAIQRIEDTPGGLRAYFGDDAESEDADLLAMCVGVRANTGFVDRKQVAVAQGVLVDEGMRASAEGLYAAGDVAQGKDLLSGGQQIIGLWANARYQGRTAGRTMAGIEDTFAGSIPHNITHFMGMDFVGIGSVRDHDEIEQRSDGQTFIQLFKKDGSLVGANLVDSYTSSGVLKNAIVKALVQDGQAPFRSTGEAESRLMGTWPQLLERELANLGI